VGSNGKLTGPLKAVQLHDGAFASRTASSPVGHHRRPKSNAASGNPWISWPPQFLVRIFVVLANSSESCDCSGETFVVTCWLYRRKPGNQSWISLSSTSLDLPPRELALEDERNRFTTPRKDVRLSEFFERAERDSSLLVLLEVGRGDKRPLEVEGREFESCTDFLLHDIERRTQDGDSRSFDDVGSVDMTSSDIEVDRNVAEGQY
jgi:hypothetical protein